MKIRDIAQNKIVIKIIAMLNRFLEIANFDNIIKIISKSKKELIIPFDFTKDFVEIYEKCKNFTMTSLESMFSLYKSIEYISRNGIAGDIVECGVWRGGSMMICALTLLKMKDTKRKLYLYDTYQGMSEPTHHDVRSYDGFEARIKYDLFKKKGEKWVYTPLEKVKENLYSTKYPKDNLIFVEGKVEDTIPNIIPENISLLRLDTDWYESTYHELKYLYLKLSVNGILILDDYGHWKGAKEATDKYIEEKNLKFFLHRIDKTSRLAIKLK